MAKRIIKGDEDWKENYHDFYNQLPLPYQSLNEAGNFIEVNNKWIEITGYSKKEIIGKPFKSILSPDFQKICEKKFLEFKRKGETKDEELELVKKNKSRIKISFSGSIEHDAKGKIKRTHCIFQDITEKKEFHERLKKEKERAENYLDLSGTMIISLNKKGEIILINKKGCEILGYKKGELIGKNWFGTFLPPETLQNVKRVFNELMQGNILKARDYENEIITKNGRKIMRWKNTLLKDASGKIVGILSSGEDMTERKRAEEKILSNNEEIEKFNQFAVGRELKMIELKKEVDELRKKLGESEKYSISK